MFFEPLLSATPLKLNNRNPESSTHHQSVSEKNSHKLPSVRRYPTHLSRDPARPRPTPEACNNAKSTIRFKRMPLGDITNTYSECSTDDGDNHLRAPPARIVPSPNLIQHNMRYNSQHTEQLKNRYSTVSIRLTTSCGKTTPSPGRDPKVSSRRRRFAKTRRDVSSRAAPDHPTQPCPLPQV